jgi:penicillin amidase
MGLWRHTLLILLVLSAGCAPLRSILPSRGLEPERLADAVTIARDEWGVPHIFGDSDASVAFGLAYAQAEDDFWQIEEDYLHALGRASHWYGERYLAADLVQAAFEIERLSREEYEREPADRRAIWDAFAAGLNYYIGTSGIRPRLITAFEPWMPFALARSIAAGTTIDGVRLGVMTDDAGQRIQLVGAWVDTLGSDSRLRGEWLDTANVMRAASMWALAPSRTEAGRAMLLHHEAGDFFGAGQPYDMMLHSDAGWHVRGFAVRGAPVPAGGHNARLAWSHARSDADAADVYRVTFDHPADPLMYRFDGAWRSAVEWEDTLLVNSPTGVVQRVFRFRRTHHGPIVAEREGRALAMRVARMEEGGSLQQLFAESRANGLDEFRTALDQRALTASSMYADTAGNIFYIHGNAVPARDSAIDWRAPVDGSASATDWRGYHPLSDLPQILNPASGWIQNTGPDAFHASAPGDNPAVERFPGYMSPYPKDDRAKRAQRLLGADSSWTFEELAVAAFDTYLTDAAETVPLLIAEWEQVGGQNPLRARQLDEPVDVLRSWDHVAGVESEAATLFVLWQERVRAGGYSGEYARFRAMEDVLARLERDRGSATVAWGDVNRLQRVRSSEGELFSQDRLSLPVGGAPAWTGSTFTFSARAMAESGTRYGVAGTRWIGAAELGPDVRFRSVVPFGQSGDSASAHWFDQAPLYARGELKSAMFRREEIMASARVVYRPAERSRQSSDSAAAAVRELP